MLKFHVISTLILGLCAVGCACGGLGDDDDTSSGSPDAFDDDTAPDNDDDTSDDDAIDDDAADDDTGPGENVEVTLVGSDLVIGNNLASVRYHLDRGRFDMFDADGFPIVSEAEGVAYSYVVFPATVWRTGETALVDWTFDPISTVLGDGMFILLTFRAADGVELQHRFFMLNGRGEIFADLRFNNESGADKKIGALYPLYAQTPEAALRFGRDLDLRILTTGAFNYLEFMEPLMGGWIPVHSTWSSLVFNQATGASLHVGFLTYEKAQPAVFTGIGTGPDDARALHADCQYDPAKRLEPGETLASELMVMNFQSASPFDALEHYADMLREWLGIVPWTERHPEIGVPAGWNSWSGGGSSGGYGTNIDEALMIENMDFADRELRRFGMNYFQLDDGWSTKNGDWVVNADRFPDHGDQNGIEWLLNRAADLGFLTGLWIRVFDAESSAQIVTDHPDWFTDPMLFGLIDVEGEQLDLSDPVVIDHIHDVIGMVKGWGIDWLKLDFGYLCPMTKGWLDPNLTRGEYYRRGVQAVRDALGDDIFFLNVAIKGWNYDLADSVRLTLDTQPVWDGEQPGNPLANQGLKPMYRDAARAYWLHKRVWVNHPDLMFFRAHKNTSLPPLTLEESRTFLTSVVLQGGLFKIGDRLVDLSGEAVDSLRRGLPVYGEPGRPLDLFRREYPEVWSLPVPDFDEPYHVIALLHWGSSRNLTTYPMKKIADGDRVIEADFVEAGLDAKEEYLAYEFWTESYLGKFAGAVSLDVPAHEPRVVALRPDLGRPQFLGTNRHILGGVRVVENLAWNADAKTLTGTQEASVGTTHAPFAFHLAFFVPDGYAFDDVAFQTESDIDVTNESTSETPVDGGSVLDVYFELEDTDGPDMGGLFGEMTWTLSFE